MNLFPSYFILTKVHLTGACPVKFSQKTSLPRLPNEIFVALISSGLNFVEQACPMKFR